MGLRILRVIRVVGWLVGQRNICVNRWIQGQREIIKYYKDLVLEQ